MIKIEDERQRIVISRLVFSFIFIALMFRFLLHATPSHLLQPPFFLLGLDFTYWLYHFAGIQHLIIYSQAGAAIFDTCLMASCILSILFPLKKIWVISFSVLFFLYAITYNTYIVHHAHPLTMMMLITIPFWFRKNETWQLIWEGMRYYICYIYTMSFIWKIWISNSFFYWNQGVGSVKLNLAEYLYHNPGTWMAIIFKFFIAHPFLLNMGNTIIFLAEGLMVVGFFTKKYDRILMLLPVIIHVCSYFFADVFFIEMLVLVFAFFTPHDTEIIAGRIPLIIKH